MLLNDSCKVGIVDYGLGNIFSIQQAFQKLGVTASVVRDPKHLRDLDGLILPGVGAFGKAIEDLKSLELLESLQQYAQSGKPMFGICLGLQLIMSLSYEFGTHQGLDLIKGTVERFPSSWENQPLRVPNVGWNPLIMNSLPSQENSPLRGLMQQDEFYFVHSYYAIPEDETQIVAYARYNGFRYPAALQKKNVFATQFHPEKSGEQGLQIFSNWIDSIGR